MSVTPVAKLIFPNVIAPPASEGGALIRVDFVIRSRRPATPRGNSMRHLFTEVAEPLDCRRYVRSRALGHALPDRQSRLTTFLLYNMGELMRENTLSFLSFGLILAFVKVNMLPIGEGAGIEGLGKRRGTSVGMNLNPAEVRTEPCFHELSHVCPQRRTAL